MLQAPCDVGDIRCSIVRIDQSPGIARLKAARVRGNDTNARRSIDSLKSRRPADLCEIVVKHAEAGAEDGLAAVTGSVCDAQARSELLTVVMRRRVDQRNAESFQCEESGILQLAATRGAKRPKVVWYRSP